MDLGGDFGSAAVAVDTAVGAHGAKDRVAGECHVVDGFDEGVEGGVQTFAALEEQADGAGVAVDGAVVGELVVLSELPGCAPVDEFLFDSFAFGMVADDAAAAVAFEQERLKLLLQPALTVDSTDLLHRMLHRMRHRILQGMLPRIVSGLLWGALSLGCRALVFGLAAFVVVFEVMLSCPL